MPCWRNKLFPGKYKWTCLSCALAAFILLISGTAGLWLVEDPLPRVVRWPISPVLLDNNNTLIHARLSAEGEWCLPIPLSEMGTWIPRVLVLVEDKRFYDHSGVDVLALGRAVTQNIAAGKVVSGASTITSQLVRLSHSRPRTLWTKTLEFIGAWKLEQRLTKDEILEYYLNRAPFGGPIRGVEAAARLYFGKRAKEVSLGEAALLVGLLKGPTAYRPDRNPRAALARRQAIIARVVRQGGVPEETAALAMREPLPVFRPSMPAQARHFADVAFTTLRVRNNIAATGLYGAGPERFYGSTLSPAARTRLAASLRDTPDPAMGGIVKSTLDLRIQSLLERTLQEQLARMDKDVTAAGVVVDNATAAIVAYVGNSRFDAVRGTEWVDCALAPRSPGSTLKPFVYLAAMARGAIIPASLLADTPLQLGGDAPRNFDRRFRGPVTAHTALADSLNTPAVRVLRMVGVRNALNGLREAGFSFLNRADDEYGDSLVLGAGEVSLVELARAYTTLANLGYDRPLCLTRPTGPRVLPADPPALEVKKTPPAAGMPCGIAGDGPSREGGQLHNPAAAFLTSEILKDPGRLPFIDQLTQARESAPVAFKTGTSYGLRDAWTAAYSPTHTVVVWFGKASGKADPRLLGISLAAPGAIRILRALSGELRAEGTAAHAGQGEKDGWYTPPKGAGRVRVCALSGAAPSARCPVTRMVWNIPAVWRTVPCAMHMLRDGQPALVWPPELEDWSRKRFIAEDLSRSARIVSPLAGAAYLVTPGVRVQPIALRAETVTYPVHWYVSGEYLGRQDSADTPQEWLPTPGKHTFSLLDAEGRSDSVHIEVIDLGAQSQPEELPLLGE